MSDENAKKICCKAGSNNFCDKIIRRGAWLDYENKTYCLFHTPVLINTEHKIKYNQLFKAILSIENYNTPSNIDVSGIAKSNDSLFDSVFPEVDFIMPVSLSEKIIMKSISFENCSFLEDVEFFKCTFKKDVTFAKAVFKKSVSFYGCTFEGIAIFDDCIINGQINFSKSKFLNNFSFQRAEINKKALFIEVEFKDLTDFNHSVFYDHLDFTYSVFYGNTDFSGCRFSDKVYFVLSKCKNPIDFTMFNKTVDFNDAIIKVAIFKATSCFKIFGSTASFQDVVIENKLTFDAVDISKISFKNSFFDNIYFNNLQMPNKLFDDGIISVSEMAEQYRRLKQKYIKDGNHAEAGKWHIKEKENQAKILKRRFIPYGLYKLFSGYGEGCKRSVFWLVLMLITFGIVIFNYSDLIYDSTAYGNISQNLYHMMNILLINSKESLEFMGIDKNYNAKFFITIAKMIILVQFGLMSLALRNHFRR